MPKNQTRMFGFHGRQKERINGYSTTGATSHENIRQAKGRCLPDAALIQAVLSQTLVNPERAYENVCGVEVLTFCVVDNHFHLLVRVPHRPEGFEVPLEVIVARLDRALGEETAKLMHRNLEFWRTTKNEAAIEDWRQQQGGGCFL